MKPSDDLGRKLTLFATASLTLLSCAAGALADEPVTTGAVGGGLAAGTGGTGVSLGVEVRSTHLGNSLNDEEFRGQVQVGFLIGAHERFGNTGNVGWVYRITPREGGPGIMIMSDPLLAHADGVRGFLGADPLAGAGLVLNGTSWQFTLSPKIMGFVDFKSEQTGIGFAGQSTLDVDFSEKLKGSAFLLAAAVQASNAPDALHARNARFLAAGGRLAYQLTSDLALNGSVEVSDLNGLKTVGAQPESGTAILTTFGATKVF